MKMNSSKQKPLPKFKSTDEERLFWQTHDSTDYLNWEKAQHNPSFPKLKPSSRSISIRLPESLIDDLKMLANQQDVPYQSLLKIYLVEKVSEKRQVERPTTKQTAHPLLDL